MIRIVNKKRFALFVSVLILVISGIIFCIWKYASEDPKVPRRISMEEAGKIGKKETYQVVIKINRLKGGAGGGLERGDVIMTAAEEKQWSQAEKDGFLIIKMNLTPEQAALLIEQKTGPHDMEENEKEEKVLSESSDNGRRFAVDLRKMAIGDSEEKGKVIFDKIFETEDVIVAK